MTYLTYEQAVTNLGLGMPIEQWIKATAAQEHTIIDWVRLYREKDGNFSVTFFQSFDEGNIDFLDVYEFSTIDPDLLNGLITGFNTAVEALEFAVRQYSCSKEKFVNDGLIQEEYKAFLVDLG